jgi:hypothetical protein
MNRFDLATKKFSAQQAFDCMHPETMSSLTPGDVYKYYNQAGGIATEEAYPFI